MQIDTVVFDLDDTLVDTFSLLVAPLEIEAARRMVQVAPFLPDPDELAGLVLELRKADPSVVEQELVRLLPGVTEEVLEARRQTFTGLAPRRLFIDPRVKRLLQDLRDRATLYLLTEGDFDFQNAKIDHLGIRSFFREVVIVPPGPGAKHGALVSLLERGRHPPASVVVVGNRLDREIRAGNRLGVATVWVRRGEGSAALPGKDASLPHHTVDDVAELCQLFDHLCDPKGLA
jgi:FMN phosphatase YigB (HAD superfamily)